MKRAGFTMIELIFVIVILGILSAVALPKFVGVASQAKAGKFIAYAGTLNTTTMPSIWSRAVMDGNGSVSSYSSDINDNLTPPDGITADFNGTLELPSYSFTDGTGPDENHTVASKVYGGTTYSLACADGNETNGPRCDIYNSKQKKWVLTNKQ